MLSSCRWQTLYTVAMLCDLNVSTQSTASLCVCGTQSNQKMKTEARYFGSKYKDITYYAKYNQELVNYPLFDIATSYFAGNICHDAT
jgi:hypothetical protein